MPQVDLVTQFLTPLAGLWAIHNAIFLSARFVNEMRETVISGFYQNRRLTAAHMKAIFIDWILCMAATITVCLIFAGVVATASFELALGLPLLKWAGIAVASYPTICAGLFLICSIADSKLMRRAIANTAAEESPL